MRNFCFGKIIANYLNIGLFYTEIKIWRINKQTLQAIYFKCGGLKAE